MGNMTRFLIGVVLVVFCIVVWMLAVQVGTQIAHGLSEALSNVR